MTLQSITPPIFNLSRLCRRLRIDTEDPQNLMYRKLIPQLQAWMKEHIQIYSFSCMESHQFTTDISAVDSCRYQILSLCTVIESESASEENLAKETGLSSKEPLHFEGPHGHDALAWLISQEKYMEAYLLGEMFNECLFSASNQVIRKLAGTLEEKGSFVTCRYAAGEEGVPLSNQKKYLDILKKESPSDIPVNIMDSGMLLPQHTILFVYGADDNKPGISLEHDCRTCRKTGCAFRIMF